MLTDSRKPMKPAPEKKELTLPLPEGMYVIWDWDFNLFPLPDNKTRLIIRVYADWGYSNPALQGLFSFTVALPSLIMQKQISWGGIFVSIHFVRSSPCTYSNTAKIPAPKSFPKNCTGFNQQ